MASNEDAIRPNPPPLPAEDRAEGSGLLGGLESDGRFGSGMKAPLTPQDRLRIQTLGNVGRRAARERRVREVPNPSPDAWDASVLEGLLKDSELSSPPPPPPGLAEAERYLRELESQPRDSEDQPPSEVNF